MDKLKVLIVDDEYLIRELIKRSVDWEVLGLEVVSEASGGTEGLDEVEKHQPDLIITDICMPVVDGIEFSRKVLKKYPQIKIIVLTGHDEFDYARDSVSIGIREYLLKPVDPIKLTDTIIKISSEIHSEINIKKDMEEVLPLLQEKVLNDLLSIRGLGSDILESLSRQKINFSSDCYQVGLIEVKADKTLLYKKRREIIKTIKQHFIENEQFYCFLGNRGFIVLLSHGHGCMTSLSELILNNIVNRLGESVVIGLGRPVLGIESICNSYDEASKALDYQVVEGLDSIIHYNDIGITTGYDSAIQNKLIKDLTFAVKAGLDEKCKTVIEELFLVQIKTVGGDINSVRVMASNILSVLLSISTVNELEIDQIFRNGNQPYENVFKLNSLDGVTHYLFEIATNIMNAIKEKNSKRTGKLVTGVKEHIIKNIKSIDLNLSSVAEVFYVNSSYLSRKFKQETGETFMEFLSNRRIDRAIELLKTTDLRSYEIADEIGIGDPHYFSIFFKKQVGVSISDYKKNLLVKN